MATENGITVRYVRSNEAYDIFKVFGNGHDTYVQRPRGTSEEDVLNDFL